jgi:hypothetical protein
MTTARSVANAWGQARVAGELAKVTHGLLDAEEECAICCNEVRRARLL